MMKFDDWEQFLKELLPGVPQLYLLEYQLDISNLWTAELHVEPIRRWADGYFKVLLNGHQSYLIGRDYSTVVSDFKISCDTWKFNNGRLVMAAPDPFAPPPAWPPSMAPPPPPTAGQPFAANPPIFQGGFVIPKSSTVPGISQLPPKAPLPDAHDILKFLEAELPVAQGMLAAANFFITGFVIPDGDDYRDVIRAELKPVRTALGDKVGVISSKLITDAAFPYGVHCPDQIDTATGKFAVCLSYSASRRTALVTMLALVRA